MSERLVELLAPQPGQTVVELGAGLGDTGFLALGRLKPGGCLLSTDGAPAMVAAARRRASELGLEEGQELTFAVEDAEALMLSDESFDGVLCRWGLMLVPNPVVAASEIARVLRPGGIAAVAVWADPAANDWMTAAGRSAIELALLERPDPEAPGPFRLAGGSRLREALERGGLVVESVEDVPLIWRGSSLAEWWDVMRDTSRMLRELIERVGREDAERIRAGGERRLAQYVQSDGSVAVPGLSRVARAVRP